MSETIELDKTRRYLVPVARLELPGEPDEVHLSIYEWFPRWDDWATSLALCGRSAEQGALPEGTKATCPSCLIYQPNYQKVLDLQSGLSRASGPGPAVQASLLVQVQKAVRESGLKQKWIAAHLHTGEKHLSHLLNGRASMTLEWAERILDLCGMELTVTVRPRTGGGR